MECRRCGSDLERPGDFCLRCETANADCVVVDAARERATLTMLAADARSRGATGGPSGGRDGPAGADGGGAEGNASAEVVGESTVRTTPQDGERAAAEFRNFVGRIADEIRRKRPEDVFVAGPHEVCRAVQGAVRYDVYRVPGENPVAEARDRRDGSPLAVVDKPAAEKLGGSHSTVIGNREGRTALREVAGHPHVKKVVPGPIEAGGGSTRGGVRAKVTRADANGNVRMLLRDGSSVQENRVVTTATDREGGERVGDDLNEALDAAGLSGE